MENYGSKQKVLNQKLSYVLQYKKERLIALNGAAQIYPIISDLIKDEEILIPDPGFGEYNRMFNVKDVYVDNGEFDTNLIEDKIKNISNVVFVNPNNPTGTMLKSSWILNMIQQIIPGQQLKRFFST